MNIPRMSQPVGSRFGRLTTISDPFRRLDADNKTRTYCTCRCDCGNEVTSSLSNLRRPGRIGSCGCLQKELVSKANTSHGGTGTRLYRIWANMNSRCQNPNVLAYKDYGARGITVCAEWQKFAPFQEWATNNGYDDALQIDRRNNDKSYSPDNCHWVTRPAQLRNYRRNRRLTAFGETKPLCDWATDTRTAVSISTIRARLKLGWTDEQAISTPSSNPGYRK